MHLHPFQAFVPNLASLDSKAGFFSSAKHAFRELWGNGFFVPTARPDIFLYRITDARQSYVGLISSLDLEDYREGRIRVHERTLPAREQVQRALLDRRRMAIKPVLLTYPEAPGVTEFVARHLERHRPDTTLSWNRESHELWSIGAAGQLDRVRRLFEREVPITYLADGHHRSSSQAQLYQAYGGATAHNPFRYLFCALFPESQLKVHAFHRVVVLPDTARGRQLFDSLRHHGQVSELDGPRKPGRKHELTVLWQGRWHRLRWKPAFLSRKSASPVHFDARLLDVGILEATLGPKAGWEVKYLEGPRGLGAVEQETHSHAHAMAFCLYPIPLQDVMTVADAGRTLPAKSTWFLPRMKNGLVSMRLAEGAISA